MKPQIIEIQETPCRACSAIEARLTVKRGDKLQFVFLRAWDTPSYIRFAKIVRSVIRLMERDYQAQLRAAS